MYHVNPVFGVSGRRTNIPPTSTCTTHLCKVHEAADAVLLSFTVILVVLVVVMPVMVVLLVRYVACTAISSCIHVAVAVAVQCCFKAVDFLQPAGCCLCLLKLEPPSVQDLTDWNTAVLRQQHLQEVRVSRQMCVVLRSPYAALRRTCLCGQVLCWTVWVLDAE